jgi:hypothetical protein
VLVGLALPATLHLEQMVLVLHLLLHQQSAVAVVAQLRAQME